MGRGGLGRGGLGRGRLGRGGLGRHFRTLETRRRKGKGGGAGLGGGRDGDISDSGGECESWTAAKVREEYQEVREEWEADLKRQVCSCIIIYNIYIYTYV
jgi:hypothetical protein